MIVIDLMRLINVNFLLKFYFLAKLKILLLNFIYDQDRKKIFFNFYREKYTLLSR